MKFLMQKMTSLGLLILSGLVLASVNDTIPAQASAKISPVVIEIGAMGRGVLRLTNTRERQVTYQLTPLTWDVADNKDLHEPTNDFIASPPSFTLAPHQTREIRVGFRNASRSPVERAYSLVVKEVPSAVAARKGATIQLVMEYILPVFVAPAGSSAAEVVWSVRRQGDATFVRAENRGNRRAVVHALGFNSNAALPDEPSYVLSRSQVVLAQSWREWTVEVPAGVALQTLLVRIGRSREFASVPFSQ